jgi:hypothetical protein
MRRIEQTTPPATPPAMAAVREDLFALVVSCGVAVFEVDEEDKVAEGPKFNKSDVALELDEVGVDAEVD